MVDLSTLGEICGEHGLQQRNDDYGIYWVHPNFEAVLMIDTDDNGNWEDGTPEQQSGFEKQLGTKFDNTSTLELDRYLTTIIKMLGQPEQAAERPGTVPRK